MTPLAVNLNPIQKMPLFRITSFQKHPVCLTQAGTSHFLGQNFAKAVDSLITQTEFVNTPANIGLSLNLVSDFRDSRGMRPKTRPVAEEELDVAH